MNSANTQPTFSAEANVSAFLRVIRLCEGTEGQPDPYRVCYAYRHTVQNMAQHPAVTGEWTGERLTDEQCRGAGRSPGCVSSAAGAYQVTGTTWRGLGMPDFSPASQDAAAVKLIARRGALDLVRSGDVVGAVARVRREWASLPGANYAGQGMRTMGQVLAWYRESGGTVA